MPPFAKSARQKTVLRRQLDATGRLAYGVYGLSDQGIGILEGGAATR